MRDLDVVEYITADEALLRIDLVAMNNCDRNTPDVRCTPLCPRETKCQITIECGDVEAVFSATRLLEAVHHHV